MTENQAAAGRYFRALRGLRQIRKGKVLFMEAFIRDMLDVKLLILFVASKAAYPMSLQKIYELCFQDDRLSYFDLSVAVPQMVDSGHLAEIEKDRFVITQKGREAEAVTEDGIAYPVMQRQLAVERQQGGKDRSVHQHGDRAEEWGRLLGRAGAERRDRGDHAAGADGADAAAGPRTGTGLPHESHQIYQGILSGLLEKKQPENDANV